MQWDQPLHLQLLPGVSLWGSIQHSSHSPRAQELTDQLTWSGEPHAPLCQLPCCQAQVGTHISAVVDEGWPQQEHHWRTLAGCLGLMHTYNRQEGASSRICFQNDVSNFTVFSMQEPCSQKVYLTNQKQIFPLYHKVNNYFIYIYGGNGSLLSNKSL